MAGKMANKKVERIEDYEDREEEVDSEELFSGLESNEE
jgi:hypothetical protein